MKTVSNLTKQEKLQLVKYLYAILEPQSDHESFNELSEVWLDNHLMKFTKEYKVDLIEQNKVINLVSNMIRKGIKYNG